ncbi:MAG: xanthine phosphoribosyltransferase [Candidatus Lightella neohaematopini]|nr:xanthine phosphoribosyltransferase [Candidatus Lightella neohaematopini]
MKNKYIVTWDMLQMYTRTIAKDLLSTKWKGIIAISRGGLVPSALLARELDIRYVDTFCVASYYYGYQHNINIIKRTYHNHNNGKGFIIVDDLTDTGNTAKLIKKVYNKAYLVTIFAKPSGRNFVDKYIIDIPQNTWIEQPWDTGITFIPPIKNKLNADNRT